MVSDLRPIIAHRAPYLAKIRVPDCGPMLALSVCRAIPQQFSWSDYILQDCSMDRHSIAADRRRFPVEPKEQHDCASRQHGNRFFTGIRNIEICGFQAGLRPRQGAAWRISTEQL